MAHSRIATGDFNGKLDLAVVNNCRVSGCVGNGDGTFQTHVDDLLVESGSSVAFRQRAGHLDVDHQHYRAKGILWFGQSFAGEALAFTRGFSPLLA